MRQNGKVHFIEFAKGIPHDGESVMVDGVETRPMKIIGETDKRGTEVHFLPDTEIFQQNNDYHYDILAKRLRELSFLNNGVKIKLVDERNAKEDNFAFAGGVRGFVEFINQGKKVLHPNVFHAVCNSGHELWPKSSVNQMRFLIVLRSLADPTQRWPVGPQVTV